VRNKTPQQLEIVAPEIMRDSVQQQSMQAGIAGKDLQHVPGCRVFVEYRLNVFSNFTEHFFILGRGPVKSFQRLWFNYTPFPKAGRYESGYIVD
jgi:hypothetical protein